MNIGVIFGGQSCEHDISVITGVMTLNALSVRHRAVPIYIDGDGVWLTGKGFDRTEAFVGDVKGRKVHLRPASRRLYYENGRKVADLDAVIICNHGQKGEDGCLAGLLEMCGIPYVGSGVRASAIGMDKYTQKLLFRALQIPTVRFVGVTESDMKDGIFDLADSLKDMNFPLIVKPSNLGSSIGISAAADFKELFMRLDEAFEWDKRVVIEEKLTDFIEVNCAVLGKDAALVSEVEQPLSEGFLSYEDKYAARGKGDCGRYMPAHITAEQREQVRELAARVFKAVGASGVARVDFLIKEGEIFVNEINTVPGSMASYLFAFDGMTFPALADRLIRDAFAVEKEKKSLRHTYDSDVLKNLPKK